jgi:hypothetical protein
MRVLSLLCPAPKHRTAGISSHFRGGDQLAALLSPGHLLHRGTSRRSAMRLKSYLSASFAPNRSFRRVSGPGMLHPKFTAMRDQAQSQTTWSST